jgi:phosphatidylinositol-3,4,5-trisphosphate 3-phosphatase/dual-specificity protein phosphatase PTEN
MIYYAKKRFEKEGLGVTQPCQIRYINYFHELLFGPKRSPSVVAITKVILKGKSKLSNPYIKVKLLSTKQQLLTTK